MKTNIILLSFVSVSLFATPAFAVPTTAQFWAHDVQVTTLPNLDAWKGKLLFNYRQAGADFKIGLTTNKISR